MIPQDRFRGLFHKYLLALFVAVAIPLAFNGVIEAWFGYRDQRARLDQWLSLQSASAAAEIHDFIHGITSQLGWLVQLPWSDEPDERRRTDALRLLRQAPAIVSLALLDGNGLERLYISRIGLNRIESRTDRSADPALVGARAAQIWFSDVSYNRGSEPYLTVADCRQPTGCRRGHRRSQPQADLGRDLGDQGRKDRLRLRPGPIGSPDRPSRHQPRAPRGGRSNLQTISGRAGRDRGRKRASQRAGMHKDTMLPPARLPYRAPTGQSWSCSRYLKPTRRSIPPCGGRQCFSQSAPCSQGFLPMHWRTG